MTVLYKLLSTEASHRKDDYEMNCDEMRRIVKAQYLDTIDIIIENCKSKK